MPTIVPRHRDSLPHAEGGQPLDAGGRKRHRKDDSNSDDDSWRPKSMRQKRNQHPTAADPPLSQKLPPKMKARQDSIIDTHAQKVNALSGQSDAKACHPTKESHTVDVSPDCSTTASESSSTSTTGFLPSLPINVTAHSCSFDCNHIKRPHECSVRGCTETVHKMCQHDYLKDRGIVPSNSTPLRCYRHERILLERVREKARVKSNDSHQQMKSPPVLQPLVQQPPVLQPPASTHHADETSTSARTIGSCHCAITSECELDAPLPPLSPLPPHLCEVESVHEDLVAINQDGTEIKVKLRVNDEPVNDFYTQVPTTTVRERSTLLQTSTSARTIGSCHCAITSECELDAPLPPLSPLPPHLCEVESVHEDLVAINQDGTEIKVKLRVNDEPVNDFYTQVPTTTVRERSTLLQTSTSARTIGSCHCAITSECELDAPLPPLSPLPPHLCEVESVHEDLVAINQDGTEIKVKLRVNDEPVNDFYTQVPTTTVRERSTLLQTSTSARTIGSCHCAITSECELDAPLPPLSPLPPHLCEVESVHEDLVAINQDGTEIKVKLRVNDEPVNDFYTQVPTTTVRERSTLLQTSTSARTIGSCHCAITSECELDAPLPPLSPLPPHLCEVESVHEDLVAINQDGTEIKVKLRVNDEPVNDFYTQVPTTTVRERSTLLPTVTLPEPVTTGLKKEKVSLKEYFNDRLGLDPGVQKAIAVTLSYDEDNSMMDLSKKHLKQAWNDHNNFVANGCKSPPCRNHALDYHKDIGNIINKSKKFVSNMGEMATELTRLLAIMHYATKSDAGYKHPDPDLINCKTDRDSPCVGAVVRGWVNTAMYHTTGKYNKGGHRPEIAVIDCIPICLEKGNLQKLKNQLKDFLETFGLLEHYERSGVSVYAAMFVFMMPIYAFNVDQIAYNMGNKPAPVVAVGAQSAALLSNTCKASTPLVLGQGSTLHPEAIVDKMKQYPEQALVNSDACITAAMKHVLQPDLEQLGLNVNDLQCDLSWRIKFRDLNEKERDLNAESLMSMVLHKVSQAVKAEMPNFRGKSRADVAEALGMAELNKYGLTPKMVQMYVKLCRTKEEEALHKVSSVFKEVKDALEASVSKSDKLDRLRCIAVISDLRQQITSFQFGGGNPSFHPSPHWRGRGSSTLQSITVKPDSVKESLRDALKAILAGMATDRIFRKMDWTQIGDVMRYIFNEDICMEVKDALEASVSKSDKLDRLRCIAVISDLRQQITSFQFGGGNPSFKFSPSPHWRGRGSSTLQSITVKPDSVKESLRDALKAILAGMATDRIFRKMDWTQIGDVMRYIFNEDICMEVKDALEASVSKSDKLDRLRCIAVISDLRQQITSFQFGGGNPSFKFSPSPHWRGRGSSTLQKITVKPDSVKETLRDALKAILAGMETDRIFRKMDWTQIGDVMRYIFNENSISP